MNEVNLLHRLTSQLDTLIPFLAISHQEVFELMSKERYIWFSTNQQDSFPNSHEMYQAQITCSAFLLGYSYSEVFLADLVREIYRLNPKMLPRDKQLKFSEILESSTYEEIINSMIEREILALFYQSMEKIIEYFENKLRLKWPEEYKKEVIIASLIRNCIMHNMGRCENRLSEISKYKIGEEILLSESDVHSFGIVARNLSRSLYNQANERYFAALPQ